MTTLESFWASLGLLSKQLHIISAGTVQTGGVSSKWTQDLVPIGDRVVAAGELVELCVTLDKAHTIADATKIRFDILEFDWLFSGGFDDPVASLKPPQADPPDRKFTIVDRLVSESDISPGLPTLRDVVDEYRIRNAVDYERGILVVRDAASDVTEVITWWRAVHVPESDDGLSLYFVAEIPQRRSSSTMRLKVAAPAPGVNVRLSGRVRDTAPAALADAQPVPDAVVTCAHHTARTTAAGEFVLDVRVPLGSSTVTIARPGIDTRTLTLTVTQRADHGYDIAVLDADAGSSRLATDTIPANADDQAMAAADLTLRAQVHRLSGSVVWPQTWDPQALIPLANRYVFAVPLAAGAAMPQRPATTRDWEALRSRPGVLRSARPDRPMLRESTDAVDGTFEICFLDLSPGSQYLLWVEGSDPRAAGTRAMDVIVRTAPAPQMRRLGFQMIPTTTPGLLLASGQPGLRGGPLDLEKVDRRVVDSTYNLLAGDVSAATEVLRVVKTAPPNAPPDRLVVQRPRRANPAGFDALPLADVETLDVNDVVKKVTGLQLEVLPLVPVFESVDVQGEQARWATRTLHENLDAQHPRGHLLDGVGWVMDPQNPGGRLPGSVRWVLDARRSAAAPWNDAVACASLETTLFSHPLLHPANLNSAHWRWWRADAVSAADLAQVTLGAARTFASRRLVDELVPVLIGPVPRLLGLFENRHIHLAPGHGVYADPPEPVGQPAAYQIRTYRGDWAGNDSFAAPRLDVQNWAGEDENTAGIGMHARQIADANGVSIVVSRESLDPTRLGLAQAQAAFAPVNTAAHPDYPRLWQQNAYYWIAAEWDKSPVGETIVLGKAVIDAAANSINNAGINTRKTLLERDAGVPGRPIDAFVAIHTNGAAEPATPTAPGKLIPATRGMDVMYLDIRAAPGGPDPGKPGYVEANVLGRDTAASVAAAIETAVQIPSRHAQSYWAAQGNTASELADTVHHWRDGSASGATRSAVAGPGLAEVKFPPNNPMPDIPIAYVELGFHTNPKDAPCLSQEWFRRAGATGIVKGIERVVVAHSRAVNEDDVIALLRRTFGAIPAVRDLASDLACRVDRPTLTAARVAQLIQTATGDAPAVASAALGDVVAAIESERGVVTRAVLAKNITEAVALQAGWDPVDAAQTDDRARAAYGPVLRALGAPVSAGVPDIAAVPRSDMPATRADAAAVLGAALGLRPATLDKVTAGINGVTVLPAAGPPEQSEAFIGSSTLACVVTALGRLRPVDVLHLAGVRLVDARGVARPVPYRIAPGENVILVVDTIGTAWPGSEADVSLVIARAGKTVATLAATARDTTTLTSAPWTVPLPGVAGAQQYDVTARITHPKHPGDGPQPIGPAKVSIEVVAP